MRKEEVLFAMSDDNNEFSERSTPLLHCGDRAKPSTENDEGCCILQEPSSCVVRRAKSTPDLLQIPTPSRHRKKSDDSAVGSAEESESDRSSADNSPSRESRLSGRAPPLFHRSRSEVSQLSPEEEAALHLGANITPKTSLLRPPSVVVSDHDLCQLGEESYLTLEDLETDLAQFQKNRRRLSDASTCSSFSELDYPIGPQGDEEETEETETGCSKASRWRQIRSIVHLTPFIQTFKKSKYPWVQLAGHQGNFKAGCEQGTILKKFSAREKDAFELLKEDPLKSFVPQYYGVVKEEGDNEFIQLEDLLGQFNNPCVMDCKLGVRTYLEEELMKAKEKPKLRKDMYEKMCQIDPNAPSPEEHRVHGVTKPRYMVWRETISTTATLGFRIEGIRKGDGTSSKDFKTVRCQDKVKEAFRSFVDEYPSALRMYLDRLYALRTALKQSQFFSTHEVIGSSLLFVHDSNHSSIWMIDFAKTIPLPEGLPVLSHDKPWTPGNHEDGYLIGLSNLISMFEQILQQKL